MDEEDGNEAKFLIRTPRLVLRAPRLDDARAIFEEYATDPEVTRYMMWRPHTRAEETRAFVEGLVHGHGGGGELTWVITANGEDRALGTIHCVPQGHMVELGYVLARRCWGQGFMTEAARAVTGWAVGLPTIRRVWATCDVENLASAKVLENIGMTREGVLRRWAVRPNVSSEPRDTLVFAMVR
ncbi:MAG: GNAT family N-acetyltransferase [Pseudomonadota bacterium]